MYSTKSSRKIQIPKEFTPESIETVQRIEQNPNVNGVMYFKNDIVEMFTVPQIVQMTLNKKLPLITTQLYQAVKEIDLFDNLIAYRIVTKKDEISVVVGHEFATVVLHARVKSNKKRYIADMKIITNLLKDAQDEKLVKTTATLNESNPIVDRIMEDDSVESVLMTNKEGAPILTNISPTHATLYGKVFHKFGVLSQMYIKELDPYEEIVVIRINTRKKEIILVPDREFLVVVIQHASKVKIKDKRNY